MKGPLHHLYIYMYIEALDSLKNFLGEKGRRESSCLKVSGFKCHLLVEVSLRGC